MSNNPSEPGHSRARYPVPGETTGGGAAGSGGTGSSGTGRSSGARGHRVEFTPPASSTIIVDLGGSESRPPNRGGREPSLDDTIAAIAVVREAAEKLSRRYRETRFLFESDRKFMQQLAFQEFSRVIEANVEYLPPTLKQIVSRLEPDNKPDALDKDLSFIRRFMNEGTVLGLTDEDNERVEKMETVHDHALLRSVLPQRVIYSLLLRTALLGVSVLVLLSWATSAQWRSTVLISVVVIWLLLETLTALRLLAWIRGRDMYDAMHQRGGRLSWWSFDLRRATEEVL